MNSKYFILTGAMGAGKSTLLKQLHRLGYATTNEPAREIIAEQRAIDGEGTYDRDPKLFYNLMLSRALFNYQHNQATSHIVIGDRGIADNIVYAKLFNIQPIAAENAARLYRYNKIVFFLPAWKEIYTNDEERKMSFSDAKAFGERVRDVYIELGYMLVDVPFACPEERAKFIIERISNSDQYTGS